MFPRVSYLARSAGALPGTRRGAGGGSSPGPPAMKLLNHRPAAFTFFCTAWLAAWAWARACAWASSLSNERPGAPLTGPAGGRPL